MEILRFCFIFSFTLLTFISVNGQSFNIVKDPNREECTIGVAIGNATSDGRPMVWKTRDYSSARDNEVKYNTSFRYKFISISNAGTDSYAWMGLNEHGFTIVNSLSDDLATGTSGPSNGALMRDVLGNCLTVQEFQHYLDSTNQTGRKTHANFGVIDSTGAAAIFETGGNLYWKFDAKDAPDGTIIRTNFSQNGGGSNGIERYNRSSELIHSFQQGDSLNYHNILRHQMRDFSDSNSEPVSVPYPYSWLPTRPFGYIYTNVSICRQSSVSATVVHGVLPTEPAGFSTMWTILGQPATSIALPYWPVGETPVEADGLETSALCDLSNEIRTYLFDYNENANYIDSYKLLDDNGGGLWTCTFPLEDEIFFSTKSFLDSSRQTGNLPVELMLNKEKELASYALSQLQNCYKSLNAGTNNKMNPSLPEVYPNPIEKQANLTYSIRENSMVRIELFSSIGNKVETIFNQYQRAGQYNLQIHLIDMPDGIYFLVIYLKSDSYTLKIIKTNLF